MGLTPCILFEIAGTAYGVPALDVHQVDMIDQVTPVPNAPPFVEGLVYARGKVIPVLSLRRRFGFPPIPYDLSSRLVVVRFDDRLVGLAVDSAREFAYLDLDQMQSAPAEVLGTDREAIRGVLTTNERLVIFLDFAKLTIVTDVKETV